MSYNSEHFSKEIVDELNKELEKLIQKQSYVLDFLRDYLVATNKQDQIKNCECFIELAIKIRLNLESANDLLPKLHEDYRFKTSINLLYRCIVDDLISVFYLSTFLLKDDNAQQSLENELNILHKEFLSSSSKGIDADNEHLSFIYELLEENPPLIEDFRSQMIAENPELFDGTAFKNNEKLRESSHPEFQELLKDTNGSGFISESRKLRHIKLKESALSPALEGLFKHLSQYQHYSPKMHEFVLSNIELDLAIYNKILYHVLNMIYTYMKFIVVAKPELFVENFEILTEHVTEISRS